MLRKSLFFLLIAFYSATTAQPTSGLVAHYPFTGNTNDLSGNGNHGTNNGATLTTDRFGNANSAMQFNGTSDYILVPSSTSFPSDAITTSFWFNRNSIYPGPGGDHYISKEEAFSTYLYNNTTLASQVWKGGSGWTSWEDGPFQLCIDDQWYFYASTFANSEKIVRIYVNGVLVNTINETDPNAVVRTSAQDLFIGRNGSSAVYYINGKMDDIRIYDRALSSAEIQELYGEDNYIASAPSIASFSPANGAIGTSVTIEGANFNCNASGNVVYFGATRATVTSASETQLTVTAPPGATYQPISVTSNGLTAYASKPFTVTFDACPGIDESSFASKIDFSTGSSPYDVEVVDLDSDGRPDVAVVNHNSNTISIFRNTSTSGSISFDTRIDFLTASRPTEIAFGDLDGDGDQDLAVSCRESDAVSVFQNTSSPGTVSMEAKIDIATDASPHDVVIGDFDGDGRPDLATANWDGSSASVIRSKVTSSGPLSTSSFETHVDFPAGSFPLNISFGDLDNDNKPEILVANNGQGGPSNALSVFHNSSSPGAISFDAPVEVTTANGPSRIAIGDIDDDGKPDLCAASTNGVAISILRNQSTSGLINSGSFATSFTVPFKWSFGLALADVNGDSKVDVASNDYFGDEVSIFRNLSQAGSFSFSASADIVATASLSAAVALGDLDGDGKPEIISSNYGSASISIFRNIIPPGTSEPSNQPTGIAFSNVTSTSMDITFSSASDSPDGYLILKKASSGMTSAIPADGTDYTVGSMIGDGLVVSTGTSLTLSQNSLDNCTEYYYQIFSYNGTGSCVNYRQSTPLTGNESTLPTLTPTVALAASPNVTVCGGTSVAFTATASDTGGGTVSYDFKINGISVQNGSSDSYTSSTLANADNVTCDISIMGGVCLTTATASSNSILMTVDPNFTPSVSLSVSPDNNICEGTSVTFTATASDTGGGTVSYDFKINGISVQNGSSDSYTSSTLANADNVICGISITGGVCLTTATSSSNSILMTVNPNLTPSASLSVNPGDNICEGTAVKFTATASDTGGGMVSYDFKINGISVQNGSSDSYTSSTLANADDLTCDISITGGLCLTTATAFSSSILMTLAPNLTPSVGLSVSPDDNICEGTAVTFTATASDTGGGMVSYDFKINGISVQNGTSDSFTSSTLSNNDNVTCDVSITGRSCLIATTANSSQITLLVKPVPAAPSIRTESLTQECSGGKAELHSTSGSGNQWYRDGIEITGENSPNLTVTAAGAYTASVTLAGCRSVASNIVNISFDEAPVPVITGFTPSTGLPGSEVIISGENFSPVPDENTVTFNGIIAIVVSASPTALTVIVPDDAVTGPISVHVCNDATSTEDFLVIKLKIQINDLITPFNLDGINDHFKIENIHLTLTNKVILLDRYGVVLKEWINFINYDDPNNVNPGDFNIDDLTVGSYLCILQYQLTNEAPVQEMTQVITVLR
jgi:hypothetical protein